MYGVVEKVTVFTEMDQHRYENVSGCCDVRVQTPSQALDLRI